MDIFSNTNSSQINLAGRYLTFALSRERYGFEILKIQEIIGVTNITRVPKCPAYIKGVINLRGKIIPLVDLRLKFGLAPAPYNEKTCIIVVNIHLEEHHLSVGVIVDTVLEVVNFSQENIEPAPDYGTQLDSRFIIGMGRKPEGDLNILIDIERTLSNKDFENLSRASK